MNGAIMAVAKRRTGPPLANQRQRTAEKNRDKRTCVNQVQIA
jgi:hypothetical protein